ncbi:MAG: transposase [Chloroflexi bacterium]|nr:transposase [Chloroflexota bacterium]
MCQCATAVGTGVGFRFWQDDVNLGVQFDGGHLTSDGGLPWLVEAETALGVCAALAARVPEWRRSGVRHSLERLVRQRVFQIACGYEDQNDADRLRMDPAFKLACGRLPASEPADAVAAGERG